jgi:hypothetical protein
MNTFHQVEETLVDQGKDGEINSHDDGTGLEWLTPWC